MLFQFYHIEKKLTKDRKLLEQGKKELEELDDIRDKTGKRFKKKKAEQAKAHQRTMDLEKQIRAKEKEIRKKVTNDVMFWEVIDVHSLNVFSFFRHPIWLKSKKKYHIWTNALQRLKNQETL